jgi:formate dehydrogenase maturation protein FdhE
MPSTISLYCPHCADRIHRPALSLSFDEMVACPACKAETKAGMLLTGEGKTLLDYLAARSVQAAKRLNT